MTLSKKVGKKASKPRRKTKTPRAAALTARTADKHVLYEASVQDTEADIEFLNRVFQKERGRKPLSLREDFCGTARLCADWAASDPQRTAVGLDLHQPTMDWGARRHIKALPEDAQKRVQLLRRNVLDGVPNSVPPLDMAVAFNFSYCIFKERAVMLNYFKKVFAGLGEQGCFALDIHGGTESFEEMEESSKHRGFTYVWDQHPYDAITGEIMRYIHFKFPDGTMMKRAFSYDWRMWTLPELRDLLLEAGFDQVDVYWEGAEEDGTGNGIFRKTKHADNELSWIAYIMAWRTPRKAAARGGSS